MFSFKHHQREHIYSGKHIPLFKTKGRETFISQIDTILMVTVKNSTKSLHYINKHNNIKKAPKRSF